MNSLQSLTLCLFNFNNENFELELEPMYASHQQKYPFLVNRKLSLFLQDKPRPNTARRKMAKKGEVEGI